MSVQVIRFLNQLKAAALCHRTSIKMPLSNRVLAWVKMLYSEGYIQSFKIIPGKFEESSLLYIQIRQQTFHELKIVSKPGKIRYLSYADISRLSLRGRSAFFSTDLGYLTLEDCIRFRVGGAFFFSL